MDKSILGFIFGMIIGLSIRIFIIQKKIDKIEKILTNEQKEQYVEKSKEI